VEEEEQSCKSGRRKGDGDGRRTRKKKRGQRGR
jgi:hypothetical protein